MQNRLEEFINLSHLFNKSLFKLYLVGGTVRDFLLGLPLNDMDAVTDATPDDIKKILPSCDMTFAKFGSVKYKINGVKFDITTLREESDYKDYRHPGTIRYVRSLEIDVKRRDFTVNALYLDEKLHVIDFVNGQLDLENRVLNMVGDPMIRFEEDPLRILRAIRFSLDYDLNIPLDLEKAIKDRIYLLEELNIDKVKSEIKKIKTKDKEKVTNLFNKFNMIKILYMVK